MKKNWKAIKVDESNATCEWQIIDVDERETRHRKSKATQSKKTRHAELPRESLEGITNSRSLGEERRVIRQVTKLMSRSITADDEI